MNRILFIMFALGGWAVSVGQVLADPGPHLRSVHYDRAARWYNANVPWHGPYQHVQWGRPVALIVPPVATMHTDFAWGVARTRMAPIRHQFVREPVDAGWAYGLPTPPWPWDTAQFGVYYVRGPW